MVIGKPASGLTEDMCLYDTENNITNGKIIEPEETNLNDTKHPEEIMQNHQEETISNHFQPEQVKIDDNRHFTENNSQNHPAKIKDGASGRWGSIMHGHKLDILLLVRH